MLETYSRAATAYGNRAHAVVDQRQMEANALLRAARRFEEIRSNWEPGLSAALDDVLLYNRKLWTIFAAEAANDEHELPLPIRNNIANIAIFVFKRSVELQAAPSAEKIDALIEINKNIAAGLLTRPPSAEAIGTTSAHAGSNSAEA